MKGFVETPPAIVDLMVEKLFKHGPPSPHETILDAGCGTGPFIEGIIRWCKTHNVATPRIVGIELNRHHSSIAKEKFRKYPSVRIERKDFLLDNVPNKETISYNYAISNPPYVPITKISEKKKERYRSSYKAARGRFDLYLLFFERAFQLLRPGGRLVFITPEKFLYVETAAPLRRLMSSREIEEIHLMDEKTFGNLTTYPAITTIANEDIKKQTCLISRQGQAVFCNFPKDGSPWRSDSSNTRTGHTLKDICERISCGVATGADDIFVRKKEVLTTELRSFAYQTVSGRELSSEDWKTDITHFMLIPYDREGCLLKSEELGSFLDYLSKPKNHKKLEKRTCVARGKPWYAFHENPPLNTILTPKILCKDITNRPHFWIDRKGTVIPRHSVYYLIPKDPAKIDEIVQYLNSNEVKSWLESHCQRAANAFLRMQSHILKQVPITEQLMERPLLSVTCEDQPVQVQEGREF